MKIPLIPGGIILLAVLLLPSCSALELELNDDEFTNQEVVMYTVRGEPYQNCTVLFGDNRFNMYYDAEKVTLNDTGVFVGYFDLTDDRNYDVTHWISVQNRSSSATVTYILRYSDAQRFQHDEEMRDAVFLAIAVVLGLIVTTLFIIAFHQKEKRLKAEGKLTSMEKFALQLHNRFQMNRVMSVWDKVAPSNPKEQHRYDYKLIAWTQLALVRAIHDKEAYIERLMVLAAKRPFVRKAVIEYLKKEGIWPIGKMTVDQEEAVLRPGEPVDLRKLLRKESPRHT
jgi:hypothetical protein